MLWVNSITSAFYSILSSDYTIVNSDIYIDLYQFDIQDYISRPRLNIERPTTIIEPRRSNITQPWMGRITIPVIATITNAVQNRGIIELDELTTTAMTVVNCNRTLNNEVDMLVGFEVSPMNSEILEDMFFSNQIDCIFELLL
jgi:hypothetical protein